MKLLKWKKEPVQPPQQQGMSIEQAISTAYAHWNAGQTQQAEFFCRKVLAVWPEQPDALHLLGLLAYGFGNRDSALDYMRRACAAPRAPALFHSNLAEMLRQSGRLSEAEAEGRRAVALDAHVPEAWTNLGIVLQESGKLEESLSCLTKVCQLSPTSPEAHNNLGNTFKRLGRLNEARAEYEEAIRLNPSYSEVHSNLAILMKDLGASDEAMTMIRHAIDINPRNADAYLNAASIALVRKRPDEAIRWIDNILSFAPEHPGALLALAAIQLGGDDLATAMQTARRAVAAAPQSGEAHEMLGQVLQALYRFDEAEAEYEQAAKLPMPTPELPIEKRGALLLGLRRNQEAQAAFDEALTLNPRLASVWYRRSEIKTFGRDDADLATMERLLAEGAQQGIGLDDRIALQFALGKACLDAGEDDRAFVYLDEANRLKRSTLDYDATAMDQWLDGIVRAFPPEQLARLAGHGDPSELPLFIVGMPCSGIALAERILALHPLVRGAGTLPLLQSMIEKISGPDHVPLGYPQLIESTEPGDLPKLARHYLDRVSALASGRLRITSTMPTNFLYAGFIHALFPQARIIHCRRDPVDTCLFCYGRLFFSGGQNFAYDLAELGKFYRGYERLAAHWKSVLPEDRYTEVRYEDMVENPEGEARRLMAFCGLEDDAVGLPVHELEQSLRTANVGRWKRCAKHLAPLLQTLGLGEGA